MEEGSRGRAVLPRLGPLVGVLMMGLAFLLTERGRVTVEAAGSPGGAVEGRRTLLARRLEVSDMRSVSSSGRPESDAILDATELALLRCREGWRMAVAISFISSIVCCTRLSSNWTLGSSPRLGDRRLRSSKVAVKALRSSCRSWWEAAKGKVGVAVAE